MTPEEVALTGNIKAEAASPETILVVVRGRVAIFAEDIVGKTDEQMLELINARLENKE
jgi:hypothetical protein